jgi:hypothetical protein
MAQADDPSPGVASRGFSLRRVLPPSHVGPPPPPPPQNPYHHRQIDASRPPPRRFHGVRPPAASAVPMRAPAASSGGTSDNLQQTPCHSVPHVPGTGFQVSGTGHRVPGTGAGPTPGTEHRAPKTEPGQWKTHTRGLHPVSCILHPASPECVYAVRHGVDPGRQAPSRSRVGSPASRSGGCPLRWTLQTPFQVSRLAKQVRACFSKHNPGIPPGTRHRSRSDDGDRMPRTFDTILVIR